MLSDIILSDHQVAIELIKDKMFRVSARNTRAKRLWISPKEIVKHIDCPSASVLRSWLREYYENTPGKGGQWIIDPEMALEITQHWGFA